MDHLQGRWPVNPTPLLTDRCTTKEGGANFGLTFQPSYPASLFRLANRQPGTDEELEQVTQVLQNLTLEEQAESLVTSGPVPKPPSLNPQDSSPTTQPTPSSQPPPPLSNLGAKEKSRPEKEKGPPARESGKQSPAKRTSAERRQKRRAKAKHVFA